MMPYGRNTACGERSEMMMSSSEYGYGSSYEGGYEQDQPQMMMKNPCEPCSEYRNQSYMGVRPAQGQIVRVYSKADPDYSLGIRDGRVMMLYFNSDDPTQQWIKDERWSNRVTDAVGHPAFCLVNKATGQALRHAAGPCQEALLAPFDGANINEKTLWSQSEDMGYGYRTIRSANDMGLNLDAYKGDPKYGGIREGTSVCMWGWNKHPNQLWKLSPCY